MYQRGLLIGRFQPLHKGHVYLIKYALKKIDRLVIGIGSTNVKNADNPYPYELRLQMLTSALEHEQLMNKIDLIFPNPDVPDDTVWLEQTLKSSGKIDVVVGNNDWVNGIFKGARYPILTVPYLERHIYEGRRIRTLMQAGKSDWHTAVPSEVDDLLKTL